MTTGGVIWIAGMLPCAVLCSARLEHERRSSVHEDERRATGIPAVGGVVGGVVWPALVAALVVVGAVWLIGRSGRTVLMLLGAGDGGE